VQDDCQHDWEYEENAMHAFGGVDVSKARTCRECGLVQEPPYPEEAQ
jgi:hypothetical protein